MSRGVRSLAHYARWIERRWCELLERPVVLSSRDWELIRDWHARRVPLELIGECIDGASERFRSPRARARPRGLRYLAPAVEEAWSVVVASGARAAQAPPKLLPRSVASNEEPAAERLRRYCAGTDALPELREFLSSLIAASEAGLSAEEVERRLDSELPQRVSAEVLTAVDQELDADLASYHGRLPPEQLARARARARVRRLRRRLGLPRMTPLR